MSEELFDKSMGKELFDKLKGDFARDGYIILRNVLKPEEVAALNADIDGLMEANGNPSSFQLTGSAFAVPNILKLVENEKILPLVVNLLGYNIQLQFSHLIVRRPLDESGNRTFGDGKKATQTNAVAWHRDGPSPQFPHLQDLSLKACYILSDLSEPNRGNTKVLPGSHRDLDFRPPQGDPDVPVPGEVQICGKPGDVMIFTQNLWHGATYNLSQIERRTLFLAYSVCWMRAVDYRRAPEEILAKASPYLKQLLGEAVFDTSNYYMHVPGTMPLSELWVGDEDVETFAA